MVNKDVPFWKRLVASMLVLSLLMAACIAAEGEEGGLPTPVPAGGPGEESPPAAWIIVDGKYVPATYGSFCHKGACVDKDPPQTRQELSTAPLTGDRMMILMIGSGKVQEYRAIVQGWTGRSGSISSRSGRELKGQGGPRGDFVVSTLEPTGNSGDQLLIITARYPDGNATYLWRLNPSK